MVWLKNYRVDKYDIPKQPNTNKCNMRSADTSSQEVSEYSLAKPFTKAPNLVTLVVVTTSDAFLDAVCN